MVYPPNPQNPPHQPKKSTRWEPYKARRQPARLEPLDPTRRRSNHQLHSTILEQVTRRRRRIRVTLERKPLIALEPDRPRTTNVSPQLDHALGVADQHIRVAVTVHIDE